MDKPKPILVTCAIIERERRYLITQRPNDGRSNGGRWEFPGGTLRHKENPYECIVREIEEEMGIKITADEIFEISSNVYGGEKHVVLLAFHCTFVSGEIKKQDIADFAWATPEEMKDYDITEADLPIIETLKKRYG
jgi:8-oxo-dGTP diphosphatase